MRGEVRKSPRYEGHVSLWKEASVCSEERPTPSHKTMQFPNTESSKKKIKKLSERKQKTTLKGSGINMAQKFLTVTL